jgi:hypothetical protein
MKKKQKENNNTSKDLTHTLFYYKMTLFLRNRPQSFLDNYAPLSLSDLFPMDSLKTETCVFSVVQFKDKIQVSGRLCKDISPENIHIAYVPQSHSLKVEISEKKETKTDHGSSTYQSTHSQSFHLPKHANGPALSASLHRATGLVEIIVPLATLDAPSDIVPLTVSGVENSTEASSTTTSLPTDSEPTIELDA